MARTTTTTPTAAQLALLQRMTTTHVSRGGYASRCWFGDTMRSVRYPTLLACVRAGWVDGGREFGKGMTALHRYGLTPAGRAVATAVR